MPLFPFEITWLDALYFAGGTLVGWMATNAENFSNECLGDIASIVDAGYNVYFYMDTYMETQEDVQMAWAITYLIKGFEKVYSLECSTVEADINKWITDTFGVSSVQGPQYQVMDFSDGIPFEVMVPKAKYEPLVR